MIKLVAMRHSSLPQMVLSNARVFGPKPILREYGDVVVSLTWLDLWASVLELANVLLNANVKPKDRVIIPSNGIRSVVAEISVQAVQGIACPLPSPLTYDKYAEELQTKYICTDAPIRIPHFLVPIVKSSRFQPPTGHILEKINQIGPDTLGLLLVSDGRYPIYSQRNIISLGEALADAIGANISSVWLCLGDINLPFFRITGLYGPMASTGEAVFLSRDPIDFLSTIKPRFISCSHQNLNRLSHHLITWLEMRWYLKLCHFLSRKLHIISPLKLLSPFNSVLSIIIDGQISSDLDISFFKSLGIQIYPTYGYKEAGPILTICKSGDKGYGKALDCVKIIKDNNNELLIRGDGVSCTYYTKDAGDVVKTVDGWYHTKDKGDFDSSNNLIWVEKGI